MDSPGSSDTDQDGAAFLVVEAGEVESRRDYCDEHCCGGPRARAMLVVMGVEVPHLARSRRIEPWRFDEWRTVMIVLRWKTCTG